MTKENVLTANEAKIANGSNGAMFYDAKDFLKTVKGYKDLRYLEDGTQRMIARCKVEDVADFLGVPASEIEERYQDKNTGEIVKSPYVTIWLGRSCGEIDEQSMTVATPPTQFAYFPANINRNGKASFVLSAGRTLEDLTF